MVGKMSALGVPSARKMRSSSSLSDVPAKSGRPFAISAKMQPTDHTSTGVEYLRLPISTSGARYLGGARARESARESARDQREGLRSPRESARAREGERDLGDGPERDDLVRVRAHGDAERAREPKVGELELALAVDEQVLRLEVAVQHAVEVAVRDAVEQLGGGGERGGGD